MLKRVGEERNHDGSHTSILDARFPAPFEEGLEYSSPARGTWNIVHTGMLIPESHQVFVCAQGCLRGVVLTAAEMNAMHRYSSIRIEEENVLDGTMEELMIDGVTDILSKLPYRPKAILLFISCQHFFLAYDQELVFDTLRQKFPDIRFLDCYMIPTLRKSGLTPDQKMRMQMFRLLEPMEHNEKKMNLIGSNLPIAKSCEMVSFIKKQGYELHLLNDCQTFEEYLHMAEADLNLVYEPIAIPAAKDLKERLGQEYLYLTFSFQEEEIDENYKKLATWMQAEIPDMSKEKEIAYKAIEEAKEVIGNTPIVVDYTFTFRILSFVRFLLERGFYVTEIYADAFLPEDRGNFLWIKEHAPWIEIISCARADRRFLEKRSEEKVLAIGQKAAFFAGTDYFVNVVESGGLYGYDGMRQIGEQMKEAYLNRKDRKDIIQRKGYGCESCI